MPIRSDDPFRNPFSEMRSDVNAYLGLLQDENQKLPLLFGPQLKVWPGRWREHFQEKMEQAPAQLVLEIGSHLGEVILQMARDEKASAFVGMDITLKRVVTLAQKTKEDTLDNLTSVLCNARGLDKVFADRELDATLVFFPDPWDKKKRQKKNRLLSAEFLEVLGRKLKPEGYLWFKTDSQSYLEAVHEALDALNWIPLSERQGLPERVYTSKFERRFRDQGLPTYASIWAPPLALQS